MTLSATLDPRRFRQLPNALSALRLLVVPILLSLAWLGEAGLFAFALAGALVTDVLDGFLARRLGIESELGARLDSRADLAIWLSIPLCAWWLRPEVVRAEAVWIALGLLAALLPLAAGWSRYRQLTSYHTWGAKASAVALGVSVLALFATGAALPMRFALALLVVSQLEELAITALLPSWQADVPSFWHARRLGSSQ